MVCLEREGEAGILTGIVAVHSFSDPIMQGNSTRTNIAGTHPKLVPALVRHLKGHVQGMDTKRRPRQRGTKKRQGGAVGLFEGKGRQGPQGTADRTKGIETNKGVRKKKSKDQRNVVQRIGWANTRGNLGQKDTVVRECGQVERGDRSRRPLTRAALFFGAVQLRMVGKEHKGYTVQFATGQHVCCWLLYFFLCKGCNLRAHVNGKYLLWDECADVLARIFCLSLPLNGTKGRGFRPCLI